MFGLPVVCVCLCVTCEARVAPAYAHLAAINAKSMVQYQSLRIKAHCVIRMAFGAHVRSHVLVFAGIGFCSVVCSQRGPSCNLLVRLSITSVSSFFSIAKSMKKQKMDSEVA